MDRHTEERILELLEKDAKLKASELAVMLGLEEDDVSAAINNFEKTGIIRGYHALVNWDKTDDEKVSALIELKVTPQRGNGFDKIAEKIYQYPEVDSLYLMSGRFDFTVMLRKATMKEIAHFVASKLAVIDGVQSTATHVVLLRYKDRGFIMTDEEKQKRMMVNL
ncbi:MAG: Lrp/AsnC family transcriptional regulator [Synergistaceae bacterium]|nr:Lrp/AsnC family transcriptional regulator [Candidatus Equadaptatus faecalis]